MSLLSQKKENDRIAAEAAAKAKEEAFLRDLAVHPVVKMECGRDVRDAYLCAVVIAAIANDDKIDEEERCVLDRIALSMELLTSDVDKMIAEVEQLSVDEKLRLLEETVGAFKDQVDVVKFFYAQFAELWFTGEYNLGELKEIAGMLVEWSGVEFPTERLKDIMAVVSNTSTLNSALDDLTAWLGDENVKRLSVGRYGDVSSRIEQLRKEKREAARAEQVRLENARVEVDLLINEIWGNVKDRWYMSENTRKEIWIKLEHVAAGDVDWIEIARPRVKMWKESFYSDDSSVRRNARCMIVWLVVCIILVLQGGDLREEDSKEINSLLAWADLRRWGNDFFESPFLKFVDRKLPSIGALVHAE